MNFQSEAPAAVQSLLKTSGSLAASPTVRRGGVANTACSVAAGGTKSGTRKPCPSTAHPVWLIREERQAGRWDSHPGLWAV